MNAVDIASLRELAEAPTRDQIALSIVQEYGSLEAVEEGPDDMDYEFADRILALPYLAATSPDVVLALLDEREALEARCAQLENEIDGHRQHYTCLPDRREP